MTDEHDRFMQRCLELSRISIAEGNRPIGALVVRDGEMVGEGRNQSNTVLDPSAHAEVAAIRDACERLGKATLEGLTLYSAMEPCPMCLGTILEAKLARLVLGGRHAGIGRKDRGRYSVETMLDLTAGRLEVITGIRARECELMRLDWNAAQAARG